MKEIIFQILQDETLHTLDAGSGERIIYFTDSEGIKIQHMKDFLDNMAQRIESAINGTDLG